MVLRFEFRNEPIEQVGHAISKHGTLTKLAGVIYTSHMDISSKFDHASSSQQYTMLVNGGNTLVIVALVFAR